MPQTVETTGATTNVGRTKEQSRGGIMHVLLYDANRTGAEYNQETSLDQTRGESCLPKALIRKPLLTRNFPAGAFRLSSSELSGQTLRLVGAQTKIHTFLSFMEKEDTGDYHAYDEVATTSLGADQVLPVLHKWASIFPGKLPDNPYKDSSSGNFTYIDTTSTRGITIIPSQRVSTLTSMVLLSSLQENTKPKRDFHWS